MSLSLRFAIKDVIVLVGLTSPKVDILESVEKREKGICNDQVVGTHIHFEV